MSALSLASPLVRLASGLLALVPLASANTLTVGPAGSGATFTQIRVAINAAQPDDVLLVQPGVYAPIVVNKPLRILATGAGVVVAGTTPNGILVDGLAAGREIVLAGIEVRVLSVEPAILLRNSPGTLVLQDVLVRGGLAGVALQVENCERVLLLHSRLLDSGRTGLGLGALEAVQSTLLIANSELSGAGDVFTSQLACPALSAHGCTLHVWRTRLVGGSSFGKAAGFGPADGGAGLRAESTRVTLYGGPGAELLGGRGGGSLFGGHPGGPGLELLSGSSARIQAGVSLTGGLDDTGTFPTPNVRADASSSSVTIPRELPSLASTVRQATLGSSFDLLRNGGPGNLQSLFASIATGPNVGFPRVLGLGCLDPTHLVPLGNEIVPAGGAWTTTVQVPPVSSLLGTTVFFQSVEAAAGTYAIGNPELVTITG